MKTVILIVYYVITTYYVNAQTSDLPECFVFPIPNYEIRCMDQFDHDAKGFDPVNAFLLAKMNELMYPERLDFQLRWLQNGMKTPDSLRSTAHLKQFPIIDNTNFRNAFEDRFRHYFVNPYDTAQHDDTHFYFLEKFVLDTVKVAGFKTIQGFDPEIVLIDHEDIIIILFRGTDAVDNNRWAEWIGTDFNIAKEPTDKALPDARVHRGFWKSFELIRGDLLSVLNELDGKNKKIWLSGHSLGGAMSILTATYLQATGYNIANVYTYASPSAIGDKKFAELCNDLLKDKVHRFEYSLDPVSILKAPGYKSIGTRYWIDNATKGKYALYPNCEERRFARYPLEFRQGNLSSKRKREALRIKRESTCANLSNLPYQMFHHNTQWLVKGLYYIIPEAERPYLPRVDDSFPFIYYGWEKGK